MKKSKLSRLTLVIFLALSFFLLYRSSQLAQAAPHGVPTDEKALNRYKVHVDMSSPRDAKPVAQWLIKHGFDVAGMNWRKGEIEVITSDDGIRYLEEHGLKGRIFKRSRVVLVQKGNKRIIKMVEGEEIDPRFLNPQKVEEKLKALNEAFPKITKLVKIGESLQGRPILALLVSSTPDLDSPEYWAKPSILFDGLHHAREIMTPEIVMDVAESLLKGVTQKSLHARTLVSEWNVWVVPMLNTDGNNIVWTTNNWWRKNARSDSFEDGGRVYGVDINRNYPF